MARIKHPALDKIVGISPWARQIREEIWRIAGDRVSVLITGPSGTGKELIAAAIHRTSKRSEKPFITTDCAAVPPGLFPSHLFGHVKGSFTGAHHDAIGRFRAADGGTIFLDEIGELDPSLQAMLLRVLQNRSVTPVGSYEQIPADIRVVAATNRELTSDVHDGRFRKDLYYRLNVVKLETTPLKNRIEDIEPLVEHFLGQLAIDNGLPKKRLSPTAIAKLQSYHWPGNVRQLENVLSRAVLYAPGDVIGQEFLPQLEEEEFSDLPQSRPAPAIDESSETKQSIPHDCVNNAIASQHRSDANWLSLGALERFHIDQTLRHARFNQTVASKLLGISRHVLMRKVKQYGIDTSASRRGRPRGTSSSSIPAMDTKPSGAFSIDPVHPRV